ncbi:MAG: sodium:proton antiporter [Proteobacteria bacterium]|nr:sodium:proton antiporter [Pseudomonadota bacterium]
MDAFDILAILMTLVATFAVINHWFIRLPTTIGLMLISMLCSMVILLANNMGYDENLFFWATNILNKIDFNKVLMDGMLSALLFAGALHINLRDLLEQRAVVTLLATLGVVISTFFVGYSSHYALSHLGIEIPLMYCLLFGALISPTDPIAVLSIMKRVGTAKSLETKVSCESLFNDGVGVVVFLVILGIATGEQAPTFSHISEMLLLEAGGGILLGLVIGWIGFEVLRRIDNYSVEILVTLALVLGGYSLALALHTSGPIAIVVTGLLIGNHGRQYAMSETTRRHIDTFWELVDEILVASLFVLIGLEILVVNIQGAYLYAGLLAVPVVLLSRALAVGVTMSLLKMGGRKFSKGAFTVLTWGGLRGGLSVAMALSLPPSQEREVILTMTYVVVAFSILVQGVTIGRMIPKADKPTKA